jgi:hypothetical protein
MSSEPSYNEVLLQHLDVPLRDGRIAVTADVDGLLIALEMAFPFPRNRLDWDRVPGAIREGDAGIRNASERFVEFMKRLIAEEHLAGTVFVIGDGPVDLAVSGDVRDIVNYLPQLTEAPQHTYVFPFPKVAWCASLSFEGWMDFGYALSSPPTD